MRLLHPSEGRRKESRRETKEPQGSLIELDARRLKTVVIFASLAREYAKGKGGHRAIRMGICGDQWKDMRTTLLRFTVYTLLSLPLLEYR